MKKNGKVWLGAIAVLLVAGIASGGFSSDSEPKSQAPINADVELTNSPRHLVMSATGKMKQTLLAADLPLGHDPSFSFYEASTDRYGKGVKLPLFQISLDHSEVNKTNLDSVEQWMLLHHANAIKILSGTGEQAFRLFCADNHREFLKPCEMALAPTPSDPAEP